MEGWTAVSILASRRNGTLYVGVTTDFPKRVRDHRGNLMEGLAAMLDSRLRGNDEVGRRTANPRQQWAEGPA
ncbi:MAG TPA: GIY-YIG nuclease family protein, partial [Thermoanaerobaculia bacterium]|nr:GIY-YIG nuclease family protein [Thermoanaerobaculia bacterium]